MVILLFAFINYILYSNQIQKLPETAMCEGPTSINIDRHMSRHILTESLVAWRLTEVTFFAWPVNFCTRDPFSASKSTTCHAASQSRSVRSGKTSPLWPWHEIHRKSAALPFFLHIPKRGACASTPPVTTRLPSVLCTSTQRIPGLTTGAKAQFPPLKPGKPPNSDRFGQGALWTYGLDECTPQSH